MTLEQEQDQELLQLHRRTNLEEDQELLQMYRKTDLEEVIVKKSSWIAVAEILMTAEIL